ncbi:uncharacterized protein [Amphiura filiformis]|uniref:uncharacterized protein n=1 Tax=Amphiura filiformis TaxID=82378 RepID=UPI003B20F8DD
MYMSMFAPDSTGNGVQRDIKKLDLDTSQVTTITSVQNGYGLAYDAAANALYFAWSPDRYHQAISRRDLDSGVETELYQWDTAGSGLASPSINLYNGGLLFLDRYDGLYTLPKSGSAQATRAGTGLDQCAKFHDVTVVNDVCTDHHTESYAHAGRVRNSDFAFAFKEVSAGASSYTISIKGTGFAYIILSPTNAPVDDVAGDLGIPKIELGRGASNHKSGGLCNSNDKVVFTTDSPGVLSSADYRDYTITFTNGHVEVSADGQAFINEDMACLVNADVSYIGVASGNGHAADWKVCG